MTYAIGDLLELGSDYLQNARFELCPSQSNLDNFEDLDSGYGLPSGVLVEIGEGYCSEVWVTPYRAPYRLDSVYERVV